LFSTSSPITDAQSNGNPQAKSPTSSGRNATGRHWLKPLAASALLIAVVASLVGAWLGRADTPWQEAQAALARHELQAAAGHLDLHLQSQPDDAAALFLAGRTARRLGRYNAAEAYLVRCQQIDGVTDATRLEWDLFRVQQGDLGDVHTRLRSTITPEHPEAPLVLEALARGYLVTDRLMDALEACDLWISQQADHPWPRLWRGSIYERLANVESAKADYEQALVIAPDDRDVRLSLGALYRRGRQPAPAAEHFEFVLQRFPNDQEALIGLAGCRIELGEPDAAVPLLERVVDANPHEPQALLLLGRVAREKSDAATAEHWLRQAVEHMPDDPEALHQLILALRTQGKHNEADALAPGLEILRGDIDRLDRLVRRVARYPDDVALRHEAGVISLRMGREEEGLRWLESALRCPGDARPTHAALAEYYGERDPARSEFHRKLAEPR
jgi:tetratricopeptide (TPR) repeat protein